MTQEYDPRELRAVLTHPAFVSLVRLDGFSHVLCMEDPQGSIWVWKGKLDHCIAAALSTLPLAG